MTSTLTRPTTTTPLNGPRLPISAEPIGHRNRSRIALGVIVLAFCVLGAVTVYSHASNRIEVLSVRRTVPAGQQISADDLGVTSISADSGVLSVAATERGAIIGRTAAVGLVVGSLLAPSQVSAGPRVPAGMVISGATLKPGQFPIGLRAGDEVQLIETPLPTATGTATDPVLRGNARVLDIQRPTDANSSETVSLIVPTAAAALIAAAGSTGRLNVVIVGGS